MAAVNANRTGVKHTHRTDYSVFMMKVYEEKCLKKGIIIFLIK